MKKITIDEEIENIKSELNILNDIHPEYMSPEVKQLQNYVIGCHAHLENAMENKIQKEFLGDMDFSESDIGVLKRKSIHALRVLLSEIGYRAKIDILKDHCKAPDNLVRKLIKVNSYRIEFTHPKGGQLYSKYYIDNPKGKVNNRDLYRSLKEANDSFNEYIRAK